ncbi:hypothetical protein [Longimicrobium sp.]|uniref:hypothetical protein n=1 Tax=Longimicrobium sp. TaxID=2029185 RepID=UPI003B3B20D8
MPANHNTDRIRTIGHSFLRNLSALRIFIDRIGAVAVEHDRLTLKNFVDTFESLLPEHLRNTPNDVGVDRPKEQEGKSETTTREQERDDAIAHALASDEGKVAQLIAASRQLVREAPVQSDLLRTSVLISLVSYLEALIADLIHEYYARFPSALPSDDRALSLSELREIGSVEEAERFLVSKEVDAVLRESLDAQLTYFTKRPKIDLTPIEPFRFGLLEIGQRRNLYVHNRGTVNRVYRQNVSADLLERFAAKDGVQLRITEEYLGEALDMVEVCGMVLLQQCWRKWDKKETEAADKFMMNATFDNLLEEQYRVVEQLAIYAAGVPFASDAEKRIVCVNHAIALRDSGRNNEIEAILGRYDWSACSLDFQLALAAVRMDEEGFYRLLPRAAAAGELTREQMLTWPLFLPYRNSERFAGEVDTLFPPQEPDDLHADQSGTPSNPEQTD